MKPRNEADTARLDLLTCESAMFEVCREREQLARRVADLEFDLRVARHRLHWADREIAALARIVAERPEHDRPRLALVA